MIETALMDTSKVGKESKIGQIIKLMFEDVANVDKSFIGNSIGDYNRKFVQKWKDYLKENLQSNYN